MSEYYAHLEKQKREARRDYLNRLYHTWNILMARWDHKDSRMFLKIKRIEARIEAETRARRAAGWIHSFCPPEGEQTRRVSKPERKSYEEHQ